jgi:hypothetical protein
MEFEIDGITRGFKFGTYTFKIINKLADTKTVDEVFKKLSEGEEDFASTFYFACARHWAMFNKNEVDFEEVHVAEWVEELGADRMKTITKELIDVFIAKNLQAPETTGLPQSNNGAI